MEGAENFVDYGLEYFNRLKKNRGTRLVGSGCTDDDSDGSGASKYGQRLLGSRTVNDDDDDDNGGGGSGGCPLQTFAKSDEQRRALAASVRDTLVFRALDAERMDAMIDAMVKLDVLADDVIFRQGDDADKFYVVEAGTYEERFTDSGGSGVLVVRTYAGSGCFGELSLLYNWPRAATVVASTAGVLWTVNRRTFDRVVPSFSIDRRHMLDQLIQAVPMFNALEPYERTNLADALVPRYYQPGDLIFGQGGPGDGMYFVESGTVTVHVADQTGQRANVNTVRAGGHFGELALITDVRRDVSVYADGHVKLAFLDVGVLKRILGPCLDIVKHNGKLPGHHSAATVCSDNA